jgi:hypothetical protein
LAIVDFLLAALLVLVLLAFFAVAVWISFLVVFRGWRIYRPPPADASSGSSRPAPANPGNPKPSDPKPGGASPGATKPGTSRPGRPGQAPRSRRQGRR